MAATEYATTTKLPITDIWDFVQDMDNWAPFLTGYQKHEKLSETESVWTVKGDVGILARIVQFRVEVVEWSGPEHVRFTLLGLNEQMQGEGSFRIEPYEEEGAERAPATPRRGWLARALDALQSTRAQHCPGLTVIGRVRRGSGLYLRSQERWVRCDARKAEGWRHGGE